MEAAPTRTEEHENVLGITMVGDRSRWGLERNGRPRELGWQAAFGFINGE